MEIEKSFKKFRVKLIKEGILKSLLIGLTAGFALSFVIGIFSWLFFPEYFWITFILPVAVTAAVAAPVYSFRFRPDDKSVAKRLDSDYGLNERILTMNQFKNNDSEYIYRKQREDAVAALDKVSDVKLKSTLNRSLIISAAAVAGAGVVAILMSVLSFAGIVPNLTDKGDGPVLSKWYKVVYAIRSGEGTIDGNLEQEIENGGSTSGVLAIPEHDWIFTYWDDGFTDPYREDYNVQGSTTHYAIFTAAVNLPFGDLGPDSSRKEADDDPDKPPRDPNDQEGEGNGGGKPYEPANQVIDGEIDYKDIYDKEYDEVMEILSQSAGIPDDVRKMIINYFKSLE